MNDDAALLKNYADEGSEAAFAELVRRYVDLVYGAALRRTGGDAHRAADVSQQVFAALARNAGKLSRHAVLGAWLHTATRNAAINLMISEQRRRSRESEALALEAPLAAGGAGLDWERLRPALDAAIDELSETDRAAVVLRFLERRAFAEIGAALRASEDAARMKTERALDKLRGLLSRRGITSTAAALGAIVSSEAMVSAPASLVAGLASQSLAAAGAGLVGTALGSLMTIKIVSIAALGALAAFGAGAYVGLSRSFDAPPPPPIETPRESQIIASLRHDNLSLKAEVDLLNAQAARQTEAIAQLNAKRAAPPSTRGASVGVTPARQQRAMLNYLRQIDAARSQFQLEMKRPPASIQELVGEDKYIREIIPQDGEDYSGVNLQPGQPLSVTTANGLTVTYDPSSEANTTRPESSPAEARVDELRRKIAPAGTKAMEAYRAANNGNSPASPEALIPFFATPQEGADFVEFIEAQKASQSH
jgi:RNA polymerase sigma factor (sigma-70 family)